MDLAKLLQLRFQNNRLYRGTKKRDKRRRDNLCYNCRKSRYRVREYNSKSERLYAINDKSFDIIEKKVDTIIKLEETLKGSSIVQRQKFRETPREENISNLEVFVETLDRVSIIITKNIKNAYEKTLLNSQNIDQNAFIREAKRAPLKYINLLQTTYFDNFYSIYYSNKEGSG